MTDNSEGSEPIKLTDELDAKIWNVFRTNQYSSRIQDHIDPVKKIVYEYAADQLKQRDETIHEMKEALKESIALLDNMREEGGNEWYIIQIESFIDKARKLINEIN